MTQRQTCEVGGSHGVLTVDRLTGEIIATIDGCQPDCDECGFKEGGQAYPFILRFDPATIQHEAVDIIYAGYWDKDGDYEPPMPAEITDSIPRDHIVDGPLAGHPSQDRSAKP